MKPSASAPASTAARASCIFVMPQIFTRTLISTTQKLFGLCLDVAMLQQRLAHENRLCAATDQLLDISARANAAFRHQNFRLPAVSVGRGRLSCQSLRGRQIDLGCFEVAVVDADELRVDRQGAV